MPISVTLTKTHNINAVAERNGFTRQKSIETVEILLELIKQSHNGSARLEAFCHAAYLQGLIQNATVSEAPSED